jgi:hypothetical protein
VSNSSQATQDRRTAGIEDRHRAMLQPAELVPDRLEQEPSGALLSSKSTSPAEKIRSGNLRQKKNPSGKKPDRALRLAGKIIQHKKRTAAEKPAQAYEQQREKQKEKLQRPADAGNKLKVVSGQRKPGTGVKTQRWISRLSARSRTGTRGRTEK